MNIAIILSVSKYNDPFVDDLPACKNDGIIMQSIIEKSKKYHKIFSQIGEISAGRVKNKLSEFIESINEEVDELFFYFSGHGIFDGENARFVFSDYTSDKLNQTTLSNDHLDNFIRNVKPSLTVKIIDACQSGKRQIKTIKSNKDYFSSSANNFENLYFIYSSSVEQDSMQDDQLSDLTRSIVKCVNSAANTTLRYRSLIEFISDEFESNSIQNPIFISQARLTEKFLLVKDELLEYVRTLDYINEQPTTTVSAPNNSAAAKLLNGGDLFFNEKEALNYFDDLKMKFEKHSLNNELSDILSTRVDLAKNSDKFVGEDDLCKEYLDNEYTGYFATPFWKSVTFDKLIDVPIRSTKTTDTGTEIVEYTKPMIVKHTNSWIEYYKLNFQAPYKVIRLTTVPKLSYISPVHLTIALLPGVEEILVIHSFGGDYRKSWTEFDVHEDVWHRETHSKIEGTIFSDIIDQILSEFDNYILEMLRFKINTIDKFNRKIGES